MLSYDLKVGYSCNNHCKHCVIEDCKDNLISLKKNYDLTTLECFNCINMALTQNITNIVLTGGEVTIRQDFPELLAKCAANNLEITIQTNGRKLADKNIINSVSSIEKIKFLVAIHGSTADIHDRITQSSGSFDDTCLGIKAMCELGKLVILKIVISRINEYDLPNIVDLAHVLGVKYLCFAFPHGHGAARKNFDDIIPRYTTLQPILRQVINIAKKHNINIEFEAIPFCIIPYAMQLVGELKYFEGETICTQVKEKSFTWNKVRKTIKKKGSNCSRCDMNDFCEGVWSEYVDSFGTQEFKPIILPIIYKKLLISYLKQRFLCNRPNNPIFP